MKLLPNHLEKEYQAIKKEFILISNDWKKYEDQIIPEDPNFAKRIIKFIIKVIDYALDNFNSIDIKKYQEFLGFYEYEFFYGPYGDDYNYLALDETLDGEGVNEFCWELQDEDYNLTKEKLSELRDKHEKIINMIIS